MPILRDGWRGVAVAHFGDAAAGGKVQADRDLVLLVVQQLVEVNSNVGIAGVSCDLLGVPDAGSFKGFDRIVDFCVLGEDFLNQLDRFDQLAVFLLADGHAEIVLILEVVAHVVGQQEIDGLVGHNRIIRAVLDSILRDRQATQYLNVFFSLVGGESGQVSRNGHHQCRKYGCNSLFHHTTLLLL